MLFKQTYCLNILQITPGELDYYNLFMLIVWWRGGISVTLGVETNNPRCVCGCVMVARTLIRIRIVIRS